MKQLLFIAILSIVSAQTQLEADSKTDNDILVGRGFRSDLEKTPFKAWFKAHYENYELDKELSKVVADFMKGITIEIFMGTWCGDSRREVPRFYTILDQINFPNEAQAISFLDRNRENPQGDEKGKNIHHVPTFIFYQDSVELGRIIESPIESLESDLFNILMGDPSTPNYSDWED
ncbi:MAG: thioredoxin family protein [Candidatus Marinimicrobia bacterium]|nr:thioredoxin family protein [Candidatus Neomarinimicrobiota bacterium]MBT3496994.1 thioredoxin family protein [Candidatus Neomarinimicrobiota bacterium]MBT3731509.1 thioredoxin family protein [Candidatus Neomarinimicrobiota bacterium]MBT4593268.1 thioredoxin family protein [Candidatus Neomarinimicrobiota bacterium]MBT4991599.1 thioredoxin family protein [Candidatus Neomarinimicrobiota bacterium]